MPKMSINKTSVLMGILQEKTKPRKFKVKLVSRKHGEKSQKKTVLQHSNRN